MNSTRIHPMLPYLSVLLVAVGTMRAFALTPLPEGETGIAARYSGNVGIAKDPAVVFADDFEDVSAADALRRTWDTVFHDPTIRITVEPHNVHHGRKALELTFPQKTGEVGNGLMKHLAEERNVLFLRYYQKLANTIWFDDVVAATSYIGPQRSSR